MASFMPSRELLVAYCRTDYRVELPNRYFSIHLGQPAVEVDELLRSAGHTCWTLITAENPRSERLSEAENAARCEQLRQRLERGGRPLFPTIALCPDANWPPEHGHLVLGLQESEALNIAAQFDQHAILCGQAGARTTLRFVDLPAWTSALTDGLKFEDAVVRWLSNEVLTSDSGR